ncbi:MAG: hypothetical protein M1831_000491 [Alyxoria varia]|nr:MAG: hypothetical protein M1831_000491 [Alyxoria varia]
MNQHQHGKCFAETIPTELWETVLSFLCFSELRKVGQVNQRLRALSQEWFHRKFHVLSTYSGDFHKLSQKSSGTLSVVECLYRDHAPPDSLGDLPFSNKHPLTGGSEDSLLGLILGAGVCEPEAARCTETLEAISEHHGNCHLRKALILAVSSQSPVAYQEALDVGVYEYDALYEIVNKAKWAIKASPWINEKLLCKNPKEAAPIRKQWEDDKQLERARHPTSWTPSYWRFRGVFKGITKAERCFLKNVIEGQYDAILAFLLTLIPNLETFCWSNRKLGDLNPKVELVVLAFARASAGLPTDDGGSAEAKLEAEVMAPKELQPLSRLRRIQMASTSDHLPFNRPRGEPHLSQVLPFLCLPSLEYVECMCDGIGEYLSHGDSSRYPYWAGDRELSNSREWIDILDEQISRLPGRSRIRELNLGNAAWSEWAIKKFVTRVLEGPSTIKQGWGHRLKQGKIAGDTNVRMEWNVLYVPARRNYCSEGSIARHCKPGTKPGKLRQREEQESQVWEIDFSFRLIQCRRISPSPDWKVELLRADSERQRKRWGKQIVHASCIPDLDDLRDVSIESVTSRDKHVGSNQGTI